MHERLVGVEAGSLGKALTLLELAIKIKEGINVSNRI